MKSNIWICLKNEGDKDYIIKKGDSFAQGIIQKYYVTDDDNANKERAGGLGSTNRGEDKDE